MKAAIYARMSTDKQSADSFAHQIARCRPSAVVTLLALCLACGGGRIVPMVSKNTFMVQGSSDAEAIKDAKAFCGRQGRTAIINPSVGRGSLARGEFIFMCASPGEPGIEPPNTQPTELKPTQEK